MSTIQISFRSCKTKAGGVEKKCYKPKIMLYYNQYCKIVLFCASIRVFFIPKTYFLLVKKQFFQMGVKKFFGLEIELLFLGNYLEKLFFWVSRRIVLFR